MHYFRVRNINIAVRQFLSISVIKSRNSQSSVSSVGRASCLCREGQGFDPLTEHFFFSLFPSKKSIATNKSFIIFIIIIFI